MSITPVQSNGVGSLSTESSMTLTLPAGVTAGNLLVASVAVASSVTITPPAGWTALTSAAESAAGSPAMVQWFWMIPSTSGATTFTFTFSAAHSATLGIMEWASSTGWPAAPFDQLSSNNNGNAQATALTTTATPTTTSAGELWLAHLAYRGAPQTENSLTSGWTHFTTLNGNNGTISDSINYQVVTAKGAADCSFTIATTQFYVAQAVTFQASPATTGGGGGGGKNVSGGGAIIAFADALTAADAQWRAGVDLLASDEATLLEPGGAYDLTAADRMVPGSASVTLDTSQVTLRTLALALRTSDGRYLPGASGYPSGGAGSPDATGLTWFNVRYRPWLDLATGFAADGSRLWTRTYLGIFVLTQPVTQATVTGAIVQLTLADKSALLQKPYRLIATNLPTYTQTGGQTAAGYPAGSSVDAAMSDLATRGGIPAAQQHFEPTTATLPADYAVAEGDEPWTHLRALAATLGHILYFDALGALVRRANPLALNTPPVWTFAPGPLCTVASISRQTDFSNTFNHIIVVGGSSATALVRGEATLQDASSPYHANQIGDRVAFWGQHGLGDMTPDPTIGTQAAAQAQAQLLLAQHLGQQEAIQLQGRPLPTLAPYDRITISMPEAGLATDAQLTQLTIPLDVGGGSGGGGMSLTAAKWLTVGS